VSCSELTLYSIICVGCRDNVSVYLKEVTDDVSGQINECPPTNYFIVSISRGQTKGLLRSMQQYNLSSNFCQIGCCLSLKLIGRPNFSSDFVCFTFLLFYFFILINGVDGE